MIENKLVTGLDIDLSTYGLGVIKQPKIIDLINLPFQDSDLVLPFIMIEQYYRQFSENNEDIDVTRFDTIYPIDVLSKGMIAEQAEKDLQENFTDPFIEKKVRYGFLEKFFILIYILFDCEEEDITVDSFQDETIIVIKDKAIIDKINFDVLMKVVFKIFDIDIDSLFENEEDKWIEVTGSEKEKYFIEKFKKKERERREKKRIHLCDYINYVVIGKNRTYDEILSWSYYQLLTVYKASLYEERANVEKQIFMTGMSNMKQEDMTDWRKEIKMVIDKTIY